MCKFYFFAHYAISRYAIALLAVMIVFSNYEAQAKIIDFADHNLQEPITGTVTSKKDGMPLAGANIVVKGTQTATSTDFDGNYTLDASEGSILVVSYIGFATQEIPVGNEKVINITLEEDTNALEEIVLIGYGKQKAGDVTSAVANVKAENFNKGQLTDAGQLIQGKVAGLAVTNSNGDPTATSSIKLRGNNTLYGAYSDPLVLIDGIPGALNTVAPEDIETIDVLKDGSAAAIYGVRGTNGVVLITTKKATGAKINTIEYSGYVSTAKIARKLDFLSAEQFRELYPKSDLGANTDWLDEITRTPITHVHNVTLRGGNSQTNYIANINYNSQQGIFLKSDNQTFRGRLEVNHKMFDDKLHLRFSLLGRENKYTSTGAGDSFRPWIYYQSMRYNPTAPIKNEDGSWYQNTSKLGYENPLSLIKESDGNVKTSEMRYVGTITYTPIEALTINGNFSLRREPSTNGYSETLNHISNLRDGFAGYSNIGGYTDTDRQMELTATYDKDLEDHEFSVLLGYSYLSNEKEKYSMNNYGFQDDYFGGWHNIGVGNALQRGFAGMNSEKLKTNLISFFSRATYSYKDKYLLMASIRHEGASQFWGTNNAWGTFPAASIGWKITNENFMNDQNLFNEIKLRIGYGVTGSQPEDPFLGIAMLEYGDYAYVNGQWVRTIVPGSNPNPNLKWEEKRETNIGLDFSLKNGRLSGSIDAYKRNVVGLLYSYKVPMPPYLYPTIMANGGNMINRGIEVLINTTPIETEDFSWNSTITYSVNDNKLKSLNGSVFKTDNDYFEEGSVGYEGQVASSHRVQVGYPIGNFYGFKVTDVDQDGKWVYEDANGDKVAYDDFNHAPEDRHYIGNGIPKWYAGFNNTFRYKKLDLTVNMRGAFNFQIINEARMNFEGTQNGYRDNRLTSVTDKVFGKTTLSPEVQAEYNSYYVEDGDYWKIDNIALGYTIDKFNTEIIKSIRVYGSVNNAFTITGYNGIDPEVNTSGLTPGVDRREKFPTVTTFTLGLSARF
ncbi:SusC/RagA family TonB-linked outer membrane protein [Zunongwangia sp.]|uniref:SusC/RagA family TonB-linked outer membrane protein n=1 Tax=Zunongwangia sp. TaxID=1965325 RepID=UPI003AA7CD20